MSHRTKSMAFMMILTLVTWNCATTEPEAPIISINDPANLSRPLGQELATNKTKGPSKRELLKYLLRLSIPENPFTENDLAFLESINHIRPNSFEDAAIVVGTTRKLLRILDQQTADEVSTFSLETELSNYTVTLEDSLKRNVALKNYSMYGLVLKVLNGSADSTFFKERIRDLIYTEARTWASLLPKNLDIDTDAIEENEETDQEMPISTADLRRGDSLMMQAQMLADQGKYKKALNKVGNIGKQDPLFPSAKEKIRAFSNLAVQRLRQRAAQAFQDAMPAEDPVTKSSYLQKAKTYLEEALRDFPESNQLETVSENLVVINLDLEKIREQETQDGDAKDPEGKLPTEAPPPSQPKAKESPEIYE